MEGNLGTYGTYTVRFLNTAEGATVTFAYLLGELYEILSRLKLVIFVCRGEQNPDPHHPLRHNTPHDSGGFLGGLGLMQNRGSGNCGLCAKQCCGSGTGSVCFWASHPNADLFCDLFMTFYLWKMM
jgi:hypothetical protein